jgi:hypothetical protein
MYITGALFKNKKIFRKTHSLYLICTAWCAWLYSVVCMQVHHAVFACTPWCVGMYSMLYQDIKEGVVIRSQSIDEFPAAKKNTRPDCMPGPAFLKIVYTALLLIQLLLQDIWKYPRIYSGR